MPRFKVQDVTTSQISVERYSNFLLHGLIIIRRIYLATTTSFINILLFVFWNWFLLGGVLWDVSTVHLGSKGILLSINFGGLNPYKLHGKQDFGYILTNTRLVNRMYKTENCELEYMCVLFKVKYKVCRHKKLKSFTDGAFLQTMVGLNFTIYVLHSRLL